jgi:plastocyanin
MKTAALFTGIFVAVAASAIFVGCGGGSSGTDSTGATDGSTGGNAGATVGVAMTGTHSFDPVNATVSPGDTVRWTNTDTAHHTVASDTNVAGMNSDGQFPTGLPGGAKFSWKVPADAASGTVFFYHCEFHGGAGDGTRIGNGMAGSITVR